MIVVAASKDDVASSNIASNLISTYHFEETAEKLDGAPIYQVNLEGNEIRLVTVEGELVHLQDFPMFSSAELVVFVSRHESKNGVPILSVHVPGNLCHADFGGVSSKVSIAPANAMRAALIEMERQRTRLGLKEFRVYYEGTHHGPSLDVPALFVEIGSTEKEWAISRAGEAVAHAAMAAIVNRERVEAAVGIGGSHCNSRLTSHSLRSPVAFGHIIPSYAFEGLTPEIVTQCVERTLEENPTLILDWKGIDGRQRDGLMRVLNQLRFPVRRLAEYSST